MSRKKSRFAVVPRQPAAGLVLKALLALALPLSLTAASPSLLAADAAGGSATNVNSVVAAGWTVLRFVPVNNFVAGAERYCTAVGSSDALNPGAIGATDYRFTLSLNNVAPLPDGACERTLGFQNVNLLAINQVVPDNRVKEVTSTCFFKVPYGANQIYWLASKIGAPPNLTVADSSMTVVCNDVQLPN